MANVSTKELAKQLGVIRQRRMSPVAPRRNHSGQTFQYVIVMDFESTCWEKERKLAPNPEVIEFPAVLVDVERAKCIDEFHRYVMPIEHPKLSQFCMNLTGISQQQVDDGVPLPTCLMLFTTWLRELAEKYEIVYNVPQEGKNCCTFVTWSDWDLNVCLQSECKRKQVRHPTELTQWIDIRATYSKFYNRHPQGLNGAIQELGLTFKGREHSGISDARNTARLVIQMVRDGCLLHLTSSLLLREEAATVKPLKKIQEFFTISHNNKQSENTTNTSSQSFKCLVSGLRGKKRRSSSSTHVPSKNSVVSNNSVIEERTVARIRTSVRKMSGLKMKKTKLNISNAELKNRQVYALQDKTNIDTPTTRTHHPAMKSTPPLCKCGRRAQRKVVSNPGPNQGRVFFSCPNHTTSKKQTFCSFFKWEISNLHESYIG